MRIKDGKGKTTERIYVISASVLTLALISYLIFLVSSLVKKSNAVFSITGSNTAAVQTFDFEKYYQLTGTSSSTASSTQKAASSTSK